MKGYERELLKRLKGRQNHLDNEPFKNIKEGLGSIQYAKGNPLTKTEISIQIRTIFIDNLGNVLAPAALLPAEQLSIPIFIFGLTDFYAAFLKSRILSPINGAWVQAAALNSFGIVGLNVFLAPIFAAENGDLYLSYTSNVSVNTANVIIHCNNVAYGTFLNSFVSDLITIDTIRNIIPIANVNQFVNPLIFGYQTLFGKTYSDSIDPRNYITSRDFQQQISDIPINLPIDKNIMLAFQLDVFCQLYSMILFVEKVEPLTHK